MKRICRLLKFLAVNQILIIWTTYFISSTGCIPSCSTCCSSTRFIEITPNISLITISLTCCPRNKWTSCGSISWICTLTWAPKNTICMRISYKEFTCGIITTSLLYACWTILADYCWSSSPGAIFVWSSFLHILAIQSLSACSYYSLWNWKRSTCTFWSITSTIIISASRCYSITACLTCWTSNSFTSISCCSTSTSVSNTRNYSSTIFLY